VSSGRSVLVSVKGSKIVLESILADIQSGKQKEVISDKFYLRVGGREIQDKTTIFDILSTIAMSLLDENNGGNGLLDDGEEIVVSTSKAYLKKGGHLVTTMTFLEFDGGSRLGARLLEIAESDSA
jgi:hypothetical protein